MVDVLKDKICRCNKTPTPGTKALPIEVDNEYQAPRVATPRPSRSGVLVPIDPPVVGSRREISQDPLMDCAESVPIENAVPLPMAEDRAVCIARVSVGSIRGGSNLTPRKSSDGTRPQGSRVSRRSRQESLGPIGSSPRQHPEEVPGSGYVLSNH